MDALGGLETQAGWEPLHGVSHAVDGGTDWPIVM